MILDLAPSLSCGQSAISSMVRPQPTQRPTLESKLQTLTHGEKVIRVLFRPSSAKAQDTVQRLARQHKFQVAARLPRWKFFNDPCPMSLGIYELDYIQRRNLDLVMANSSFIIIPPMKVWSYFLEMRRVVCKGGLIAFNAIVSDQVAEDYFQNYLNGYFQRRTFPLIPRDIIDRTFAAPQFELLKIDRKEYLVFKRVA